MKRGTGLNDREREMWVNNDEGLYSWFRSSRLSMREFLRQNRAEIDAAIIGVRDAPPREKQWYDYRNNPMQLPPGVAKHGLKGKTIADVFVIPGRLRGWFEDGIALVMKDGSIYEIWSDAEGNGPGKLVMVKA
jgi:hypothetical protein